MALYREENWIFFFLKEMAPMYSLCLDYIKFQEVLLGGEEPPPHPHSGNAWQHCARKNGTHIAPSEEPYFPLVEAGFSLKSWADFTLILLPSLQSPLLILSPVEAWLHWLVALVCQQLGETDVRNRLSEVRKLSSQKNQFVNLNHLGMGKKRKKIHNVGNKQCFRPVFLLLIFPSLCFLFWSSPCWDAGASNAGVLSESRGYFCIFVSGFNVYHEYREWVPSAVWAFTQPFGPCFIT